MEDKKVLKAAQRSREMTQMKIGERLGLQPNAVSMNMSRDRMSLGMFAKILDVLDYDVVITDRKTGEAMCVLDTEKYFSE